MEVFWIDEAGFMHPFDGGVWWWHEQIPASVSIGLLAVALYHYLKGAEQ